MIWRIHWIPGSAYSLRESDWRSSNRISSITAVIQAGVAHGAQRADIYGCLYFYQLRAFADRLRRFRINFRIFSFGPSLLFRSISDGDLVRYGFPPGTLFDRINVTNVLDGVERVRIPGILADWAPLLKENKYATLLGYFTEWYNYIKNASGPMSSEEMKSELIAMLIKDGRVCTS